MNHKQTGFSLVGLVAALAVLGILFGIAVPAYRGAIAAAHAGAAKSALGATLLSAMTHSSVAVVDVVVCASPGGSTCSGSTDWSAGWIAFADLDTDRAKGANEPLLRRQSGLPTGIHLRSTSGRRRIVLQPHGGAAAGSNVTFTLCDRRGVAKASTLVLANSGRLRQDKASVQAALACLHRG